LEAHGGYLCRVESLDADIVRMASGALPADGGDPANASLQVSVIVRRKVVRLAYDTPLTYGRAGARWYEHRHELARVLSAALTVTVYAYVFDPEELEQVVAYGSGARVGGDRLRYEEVDVTLGGAGELDDAAFEKMKARWPLGHLAYVFGVTRQELMRLPRSRSALVSLDGSRAGEDELQTLLVTPRGQPAGT
jgi:hypothetical protein